VSVDRLTIICGDALTELPKLPDESVHVGITSPPYWGLRDYKIQPSVWLPRDLWNCPHECEHEWGDDQVIDKSKPGVVGSGLTNSGASQIASNRFISRSNFCNKCGAWRGVFGLEPTPELYVEHAVLIFREFRRVLRKDGTLWVNLGDSYNGQGERSPSIQENGDLSYRAGGRAIRILGLKQGDLVGIPWRVAFALQNDGWYLRRDNIWFKPNPMPESVNGWRWEKHRLKTKPQQRGSQGSGNSKRSRDMSNGQYLGSAEYVDCPGCDKCTPNGGLVLRKGNWRCTTSHEYVFQFSKSDRYFCDAEAAREKTSGNAHARGTGVNPKAKTPGKNTRIHVDRCVAHANSAKRPRQNESFSAAVSGLVSNRNRRSVWPIATAPYREAHFATFPPALVRPIIQAAAPVKVCGECGTPYAPVVERGEPRREQQLACGSDEEGQYHPTGKGKYFDGTRAENARRVKQRVLAGMVEKRVIGYRATCSCNASTKPAVVMDMFGGSGTVGQVALEEGRAAVLIEISETYLPLIQRRTDITPGFAIC
jgi:DNA modification methylase